MSDNLASQTPNSEDKQTIKISFAIDMIRNLIKSLANILISPKIIIIFLINFKILYGPTAEYTDAKDFIKKNKKLFNVDIEKSKSFYNKGRVYSVLIYKSEIPLASSPDKSIRFRIKDALETILTADSYMTGEDYRISHIESQEVFPKNKYLTIAFGVGGYDQSILTNREESNELITLKVEFAKNRINL
jgi:hypothetical protein